MEVGGSWGRRRIACSKSPATFQRRKIYPMWSWIHRHWRRKGPLVRTTPWSSCSHPRSKKKAVIAFWQRNKVWGIGPQTPWTSRMDGMLSRRWRQCRIRGRAGRLVGRKWGEASPKHETSAFSSTVTTQSEASAEEKTAMSRFRKLKPRTNP